jgi:alpha-ketoglutarate-dependent taurine dioxygenase
MSSLSELLADLAGKNIKIWADGGKLRCSGPDQFMTAELQSELGARKVELLAFLNQVNITEGSKRGAPAPVARDANIPLSYDQRRDASVADQERPASVHNNLPILSETRVIDREIDNSVAWRGTELPPDAGFISIPTDCSAEIAGLAGELHANPLPLAALRPDDFNLPACRVLMNKVKQELDHGLGFVVVDRLDLSAMSREVAVAVYWILASMVARPVAQKWDGTMVYEVCDLGKKSTRAVDTNDEMSYHTDNSFNVCPPQYVGLLCLQKAKEGGVSQIVNFSAAHNEMRRRYPELLRRLYRPYVFDRQREHAPGDAMAVRHAMFENHDGRLMGRLSRFHVKMGHALAGEPLDSEGEAAMEALESIMNEPGRGQEFWFEPGQVQIIDNRRVGHKRTSFIDWPEPDRKRKLVRLWLRDSGRPFYNG